MNEEQKLFNHNDYSSQDIEVLISNFIAVSSHKFLSPLTAIKWSTEIIKRDIGNEYVKEFTIIDENIKKMESMFEVMLKIVEVKENENPNQNEIITVNIEDLHKSLLTTFENSKDRITEEINIKELQINYKENYLQEILTSILKNMIYYSEKDNSVINIKYTYNEEMLSISMIGNTCEIQESEINFIGEPFYRGKNAIDSGVKGFGLDLYYIKLILNKIDGELLLNQNKDKTVFIVNLPAIKNE